MKDGVRRWITEAGTFRILAASSLNTVREAVSICGAHDEVAELYGEFLIGSALYQLALAPADRVQFTLENKGAAGQLVADVRPGVYVRGRLENPQATASLVEAESSLRVSRQPPRGGGYYESIIKIPSYQIADAFQVYALQSDQVVSFMALDSKVQDGEFQWAAGLFVQALPGATHEHLAQITNCLEDTRFVDQVMVTRDPFAVVPGMFYDLNLHELGEDPLFYRCGCSKESLVAALGTLSEDSLLEMVHDGKAEITCEFCKEDFFFLGDELKEIHAQKLRDAADSSDD